MELKQQFDVEKCPKTMAYVLERDAGYVRCNRCGSVVLKSDVEGYSYQCMFCDEDLYTIETHEGEWHTDEELDELLCRTEDVLELDYDIDRAEQERKRKVAIALAEIDKRIESAREEAQNVRNNG